jgi:hypothetical protein
MFLVGAAVTAILLVWVVRWRRRTYGAEMHTVALREVCPHLKPALERLLAGGHVAWRVGQRGPDMPMEIHVRPRFDPQGLYDQMKLAPPVYVSPRNVLYCRECWCELRPGQD